MDETIRKGRGKEMKLTIFNGDVPEVVLDEMVEIYIECFTGPPRFETWTPAEVRSHMRQLLDGGADAFIITEDEEIEAFALGIGMGDYFNKKTLIEQGASEDSYYFTELGTRQKCRGKGYGTSLHQAREDEARRKGFKLLNVRVRQDNETNIKLLTRLGFEQVGEYTGSIKGSESVRLILEKKLV